MKTLKGENPHERYGSEMMARRHEREKNSKRVGNPERVRSRYGNICNGGSLMFHMLEGNKSL